MCVSLSKHFYVIILLIFRNVNIFLLKIIKALALIKPEIFGFLNVRRRQDKPFKRLAQGNKKSAYHAYFPAIISIALRISIVAQIIKVIFIQAPPFLSFAYVVSDPQ